MADQLKIAQGWVRCGQCAEVFDASLQLQTDAAQTLPLPSESVLVVPDSVVGGVSIAQAIEDPIGEAVPQLYRSPDPPPELEPESEPEPEEMSPLRVKGSESPEPRALESIAAAPDTTEVDFDPAAWSRAQQRVPQFTAPLTSESAPDMPPAILVLAPVADSAAASVARVAADPDEADTPVDANEPASAEPEVSFVRDARRKAYWKQSLVRSVLGLLLLILLVLLALQWALQHKDRLAGLKPHWTPALQVLCSAFNCEIRPPRHIESLLIDSSSFTKTGADTYRLGFSLKNTGDIALEVPALELTLTDTQDHAVVRRVLLPAQFGITAATLAAQSELAGVVSLKVFNDAKQTGSPSSLPPAPRAPLRVAGYRILAFYP